MSRMTLRKGKANSDADAVNDAEAFACEPCRKSFRRKRNLLRHIRVNHRGTQFQCYYCDYTTKFKVTLSRHVRLHLTKKEVNRAKGTYVKCPLCDYGSKARETMLRHYFDDHDVDMRKQRFEFPNMEEFLIWKNNIEQTDVCQFTACSKKNRDVVQIRYYRCFRDGVFQKKGKGIRMLKLKGSVKINGVCPAGMRVEEHRLTGDVKVSFVRSHVGHSNELGLLNLSKNEKAEIALKLTMGMTYDDIISGIRGSLNDSVKRVHLTTRKDVYNIQSSFGIPSKKAKRSKTTEKVRPKDNVVERKTLHATPESGPPVKADAGNEVSTKSDALLENVRKDIVTSENQIWDIQYWTDSQEPDSLYSGQCVTDRVAQSKMYSDKSLTDVRHDRGGGTACDSSSDADDRYFEVVTPDPVDVSSVESESRLNEKKTRIGALVEEILKGIKSDEQADMVIAELLRVREAVLPHSSTAGPF